VRSVTAPLILAAASVFFACGDDGGGGADRDAAPADAAVDAPDAEPPPPAFEIRSLPIQVAALQEITTCYYFRLPNTEPGMLHTIQSRTTAPVTDIQLFLTSDIAVGPEDTLSAANCVWAHLSSTSLSPGWIYTATEPEAEYTFPADADGNPIGLPVPRRSHGYVRIQVLNPTDEPMTGSVELDLIAHRPEATVVPAQTLLVHAGDIEIAPMTSDSVAHTCDLPPDAAFLYLTTTSHRRSTHTYLQDGVTTVFESTDYQSPGAFRLDAPPYRTFESGQMTYQCDYTSMSNLVIRDGNSPVVDELCVGTGYFVPGVVPTFCFDNLALP
jgi:hypothetical protein